MPLAAVTIPLGRYNMSWQAWVLYLISSLRSAYCCANSHGQSRSPAQTLARQPKGHSYTRFSLSATAPWGPIAYQSGVTLGQQPRLGLWAHYLDGPQRRSIGQTTLSSCAAPLEADSGQPFHLGLAPRPPLGTGVGDATEGLDSFDCFSVAPRPLDAASDARPDCSDRSFAANPEDFA